MWVISGPLGCWIWSGALSSKGYPMMRVGSKVRLARRVIYERHRGPIPKAHVLRNECMERACVNPDHQSVTPDAVARSLPRRRARASDL